MHLFELYVMLTFRYMMRSFSTAKFDHGHLKIKFKNCLLKKLFCVRSIDYLCNISKKNLKVFNLFFFADVCHQKIKDCRKKLFKILTEIRYY